MAVVLSALRSELLSDPVSIGYSADITGGNDNGIVLLLNSVSANASTATSTVVVGLAYAVSMQQCVVVSEYSSLAQVQRDLWHDIIATAVTGLAISNTLIRAQVAGVWSATTATRANLLLLQNRACARSETLFGENVFVDANQVNKARTNTF